MHPTLQLAHGNTNNKKVVLYFLFKLEKACWASVDLSLL